MQYTIVTTAYNDSKNIIAYLDNISKQTLVPDRIIVADGGSKDDTVEVINEYSKHSNIPVTVISGQRLNIAQGFNVAIRAVTTEFVAVTGIGNKYDEKCFEYLSAAIERDNLDFAYPPIRGIVDNSFTKKYCRTFLYGDEGKDDKTSLNHGVLIRKKIFDDIGYFYENFYYAGEDSEFYSLVNQNGYKGACVKEARLYWQTPKSYKEFKKQLRVYTIGAMQIIDNSVLWEMYRRRVMFVILLPVSLIFVAAVHNVYLTLLYLLMIVGYNVLKKVLRRRNQNYFMRMYNDYMPLFYMVKERKFLRDENKVKRG